MIDGDGAPAPGDAMIELWQADAEGRYAHARPRPRPRHFSGFGRLETDPNGVLHFRDRQARAVSPAPMAAAGAAHQRHRLRARIAEASAHPRLFRGRTGQRDDPVLALVPEERRATLLAQRVAGQPDTWRFEIRLQGDGETVFFDV